MILDGHIHIQPSMPTPDPHEFVRRLGASGVEGGVVISPRPDVERRPAAERLDAVFSVCDVSENLFPFYWIDPFEKDAKGQVHEAVERGVLGFKVICETFEPGDTTAMGVFREIAAGDRPILFHSGILWHPTDNARFNRPYLFEALLQVEGLRFSLAHIGWPWCDEMIAVYGKFLNATAEGNSSVEMFVDVTPGTPPVYRRDALTKLFTVGYDVADNVIFGTDSCANDYNVGWAREWIERDSQIYDELELTPEVRRNVFAENLKRFVGVSTQTVSHRRPVPGR